MIPTKILFGIVSAAFGSSTKYGPARFNLAELWTECPVSSQSNGKGHNHEQFVGHQAIEREIETLEYYRTFLARLLDFVSHGEPEAVDKLFQFIRSGASQEQIFDTLVELRAAAGSEEIEHSG